MTRTLASTLCALALAAACVQNTTPRSGPNGGRNLSLRYEGSCAHLACCSAYAVEVASPVAGSFACTHSGLSCREKRGWYTPGFTCDPRTPGRYRQPRDAPFLDCRDDDLWLSIPNLKVSDCGVNYVVCARGARVIAVARDRSYFNDSGNYHYEASLGVLRALGASELTRDTIVSVYPATDGARIAADPACTGP